MLICQFLGNPCFYIDGQPAWPGRRKSVALAAFLAMSGKAVSRERLADLFWPDYDQENARASLRRTLSAMGNALGKFWFAADREAVRLVPHEDIQIDVIRFQTLVSGGFDNPDTLEQAVRIYGGPFLSGFSLKDAPEFDDWQFARKEALERKFISVLESLTGIYTGLGNNAKAIEYALAWADLDPLDESAHRHLIRLYGRTGQMGMARHQYERCKLVLDSELGIPPARETSNLARQVLSPDDFPPAKERRPQCSLPVQSGPFIGRHREMKEIIAQLALGDTRLLTITGPGGIGKTRLSVEAAAKLEHPFPSGVYFLSLVDVLPPEELSLDALLVSLSGILGLRAGQGRDIRSQVMEFLCPRKILLVLDNLDHLPEARDLISQLLDSAGQLKIIATSRSRLGLDREHLLPLSGLPYLQETQGGAKDGLEAGSNTDGVALLLSAIRRVRPDFKVDADNINDIIRICRLTSGIPLALIIAGGWGDVFSPGDIGDEIEKGIDFLRSDHPDVPPGHRSMRTVFDTSWNSLEQEEQDVFMRLSVFRGLFTRQAAAAVAEKQGESRMGHILAALVRKSIVRAGSESGTFDLHPLLIQYAGEKLLYSGTMEKTMDRHERYYLDLARRSEKKLIGHRMLAWRADMDTALANIEQAWHRAVNRGDADMVSRSATGMYIYFDMHTKYLEGERFFRAAKELTARPGSSFKPESALILLCWFDMRAQSTTASTSFREIQSLAHEWLRWAVKSGDNQNRAHALLLMGAIAHRLNKYDRAVRLYKLSLAQDPGVEHAFWVTMRIGLCRRAQGLMDQALCYFKKSLGIGRDLGDAVKIAWSLGNVGSAHLCLGNLELANSLLLSAKDDFERIKASKGVLACLEELGLIALFNGDFDRGLLLSDRAVCLSDDAGLDRCFYQRPTALKGMALLMGGSPAKGRVYFQAIEKSGSPGFTACLGMSFIAAIERDPARAGFYERAARDVVGLVHKPQLAALLDLAQAAVFCLDGDKASAAKSLERSVSHPFCPKELLNAWDFARELVSRIQPSATPPPLV